jgi:hypothetical protein
MDGGYPAGYDPMTMRPRRVAIMALPLAVLAASQAGHLLAWQLRQGPRGLPALGSTAHGYIPALTTVVFGAAGVAILAALSVVAAARLARLGRVVREPATARLRRISVLDMAAVLFVLQLAVYLAQETLEASWGGYPRPDLAELLLWGSLSQVPAAIVAGAALSWLSIRFEEAVGDLQTSMSALPPSPPPALAPVRVWTCPAPLMLPIQVAGGAFSERGPPHRPGVHARAAPDAPP